jgi:hypothetical protein
MTPKFKVGDQVIADGDTAFITQIIDPPDSHPQDGFSYAVEWPTDEWGTFSEDEITEVTLMDNKLKQLAQQAGFGFRDGELYTAKLEHLPITQNMEKFSELIARETFDWVVNNVGLMEDTEWQALKKHFKINE